MLLQDLVIEGCKLVNNVGKKSVNDAGPLQGHDSIMSHVKQIIKKSFNCVMLSFHFEFIQESFQKSIICLFSSKKNLRYKKA